MNFEHVTEWYWVTWILMVIVWVLIILGIEAFFKRLPSSKTEPSKESSLEILKKRYAKGKLMKRNTIK